MRRALFTLLVLPLLLSGGAALASDAGADAGDDAVAPPPGPVSTPYTLAAGISAKESCSCVFVVLQSDAYCKAFGSPADYVTVNVQIDHAGKGITSTFFGATRTAHFVDGAGCTLDP